jgi:hypothetical protein
MKHRPRAPAHKAPPAPREGADGVVCRVTRYA